MTGAFGHPVGPVLLDRRHPPRLVGALTRRQQQVLASASLGRTEAQTADELGVSMWTVKEHRRRVMDILDARSISHAVAIGFQKGLLR